MNSRRSLNLSHLALFAILFLGTGSTYASPTLRPDTPQEARLRKQLDEAFNKQHYAKALPIAEQLLKTRPEEAGLWVIKGCCFNGTGRTAEAEALFKRAVALDPNTGNRAHHVAILIDNRRYREASQELDELIRVDSQNGYGKVLRVKLALAKGDLESGVDLAIPLLNSPGEAVPTALQFMSVISKRVLFDRIPRNKLERFSLALKNTSQKLPEAALLLAGVSIALGRYDEAVAIAQHQLKYFPDRDIYLTIGNWLTEKKHFEEALACVPHPNGSNADLKIVRFRVGTYAVMKRYEDALNLLFATKIENLVPTELIDVADSCARQAMRTKSNDHLLQKIAKLPDPSWFQRFVLASMLDEIGQSEKALPEYKEAAIASKQNQVVMRDYIILLNRMRKYEEALAEIDKIPKLDNAMLHVKIRALASLKRLPEALKALQKNGAASCEAQLMMGDVHRQLGDWQKAIACYDRALELQPNALVARQNRMDFARAIHRYDLVCEDIAYGLKRQPNNHNLFYQKALYEQLAGKTAQANIDWNRAEFLKPR